MDEPDDDSPPARPTRRTPSAPGPLSGPLGRILLTLGLIGTALVLLLTIGIHREPSPPSAPASAAPSQRQEARHTAPRAAAPAPEDRPGLSDQAELGAWAEKLAAVTDVPVPALIAYARAEMWMRLDRPGCKLSWATLAGIGRVESRHGTSNGGRPIIGPALNGTDGRKQIKDTDGGTKDGDPAWDRAVGPMQLLPQTWQRFAVRAPKDGGIADPQDIDDAALTAANFLCSSGKDLSSAGGWWSAITDYDPSAGYGQEVFGGADSYAATSVTVR